MFLQGPCELALPASCFTGAEAPEARRNEPKLISEDPPRSSDKRGGGRLLFRRPKNARRRLKKSVFSQVEARPGPKSGPSLLDCGGFCKARYAERGCLNCVFFLRHGLASGLSFLCARALSGKGQRDAIGLGSLLTWWMILGREKLNFGFPMFAGSKPLRIITVC